MIPENNNSAKKRLIDNIIYSGVYQILVMIVPIITTPYVTRIFSVSQMGEYGVSLSIASIFVILSNFGLPMYGSREIAKSKNIFDRTTTFYSLWKMQIATTVFFFVLYHIFFYITNIANSDLFFYQSLLILVSIFDISWFYVGIEEIKKNIFRNLITKLFTTISIIVFIKSKNHINYYALINILGMLLGNLTMFMSLKKHISHNNRFVEKNSSHFKQSFFLLLPQLLRSVYASWDKTILLVLSNSRESVGIYDQGIKIINLIFSIINASMTAIMPRMSKHVSDGEEDVLKRAFKKIIKFFNVFSIIIVSGMFSVSNFFVDFFFGNGYHDVSIVLKLGSIAFLIMPTSTYIANGIIIPLKKDKLYLNSMLIMACTSVVFNFLLDSKFLFVGTALSFLISEVVGCIIRMYYIKEYLDIYALLKGTMNNVVIIIVSVSINLMIQDIFVINQSIFAFVVYGVSSVIISVILIMIQYLLKFMFCKLLLKFEILKGKKTL